MIKYICDACGKEFTQPALKNIHIPSHITLNQQAEVVDAFGNNLSREELYEVCGACYEKMMIGAWVEFRKIENVSKKVL